MVSTLKFFGAVGIATSISVFLLFCLGFTQRAAAKAPLQLSEAAQEVARDIGVNRYLDQLSAEHERSLKSNGNSESVVADRLHTKMLYKIMLTSLQVRDTISKIDRDINVSTEMKEKLESKAQHNVDLSEIANFMNTGTAEVIGTGVGLSASALRVPAGMVSMYGGGMEIGLSALALKLQKGGRVDCDGVPNMLAPLIEWHKDGSLSPAEPPRVTQASYPPAIWEYLTDPAPASKEGESRIEVLRRHWLKAGHMESGKKSKPLTPLLTGSVARRKALTVELLSNRVLMLYDLRAAVAGMDRCMSEVVTYLVGLDNER